MTSNKAIRRLLAVVALVALPIAIPNAAGAQGATCSWLPTSPDAPSIGAFAQTICNLLNRRGRSEAALEVEGVYFAGRRRGDCLQARFALAEAEPTVNMQWDLLADTANDNRHPGADPQQRSPCGTARAFGGQTDPDISRDLQGRAAEALILATARDVLEDVHTQDPRMPVILDQVSEVVFILRRVGGPDPRLGWNTAIARIGRRAGGQMVLQAWYAEPESGDGEFGTASTGGSPYLEYKVTTPNRRGENRQVKVWIRRARGGTIYVETMKRRCTNDTISNARNHFRDDDWHHGGETMNFCGCDVTSNGTCEGARF